MEIKIGVADNGRELEIATDLSPDEAQAAVEKAVADPHGVLVFTDDKGRRTVVPSARVAYVEIGIADGRRVGFGV